MRTTSRTAAIALVTLVVAGAPHHAALAPARPPGDTAPRVTGPQEVEVLAVMMDPRTETPAVVLEGKRDRRRLAMVIGPAEATGIAVPLRGMTPPRPLTHDLFLTLFGRLSVTLTRVVITDLRDDIYYATVHLTGAGGEMTLDARPSDAIALAIRARVPVLVEDRVFDKGGARAPAGPGPRI
jgi:bifunctional DNase/RNase